MLDSRDTMLLNNLARNTSCGGIYQDHHLARQTEWAIYERTQTHRLESGLT